MTTSFLVLGSGILGKKISSSLTSYGKQSRCLSIRRSNHIALTEGVFLVDAMDPAHEKIRDYQSVRQRVDKLRHNLLSSSESFCKYVYLSTANIYQKSDSIIYETSKTYSIDDVAPGSYLANKITTEKYLLNKNNPNIHICRLSALWESCITSNNDGSFFSDLFNARSNNQDLPSRIGDHELFSYMNFDRAASRLAKLFIQNQIHHKTYNISDNCWNSRSRLKGHLDCVKTVFSYPLGRRISSAYLNSSPIPLGFDLLP